MRCFRRTARQSQHFSGRRARGGLKTVLALAVAADCPVWYEFNAAVREFSISVSRSIRSTIPSIRTRRTQMQSRWMFCARRSWRGIPPTFSPFTPTAIRPRRLRARAVCADLRELLPDVTEDSLLPGLFDLLTQDGALYVLPLTVRVDTLIMPLNLIRQPRRDAGRFGKPRGKICRPAGCRSIRGTRRKIFSG